MNSAVFSELNGVTNKIVEHLLKAQRISNNRAGYLAVNVDKEFQSFLFNRRQEKASHCLQLFFEIERYGLDVKFTGFDLGIIENVVEDAKERR